jgi:ABC-2 type transport system permease protein
VFWHGYTTIDGVTVRLSRFYVGGIMAMSIITATYASLIVSITAARESGALKRRRATPVPASALIGGQVVSTLVTAVIMSALLLAIARVGYGVAIPIGAIAAMELAVVLGVVTFACLGYAVAGMIGSPEAAQPVVQATMMPLYFISGIWIATASLSPALRQVAAIFPIEHLASALHLASVRGSFTGAFAPGDLLVLAAWAIAAAVFAARRFSWLPITAAA